MDLTASTAETVAGLTLQKRLGEGPHGTTWSGRREGKKDDEAVKVLAVEGATQADLAALRVDLARLGGEHPNLVVPSAAGLVPVEGEGEPPSLVLISELVDGPDLHKFSARAPWSTILEVVVSALRGLEALHARGLVHGHVSASNVIVAGEGPRKTGRILDPGLSIELAVLRRLDDRNGVRTSLAPEALRGEPLDRRADLYDFGCLLFECATREPLFGPAEGEALHLAHLHEAPRKARDVKRTVPVAVEEVIDLLLRKDPAARPPSANAVIRELNRTANKRFSTETREDRLVAVLMPRLVGRQAPKEEAMAAS